MYIESESAREKAMGSPDSATRENSPWPPTTKKMKTIMIYNIYIHNFELDYRTRAQRFDGTCTGKYPRHYHLPACAAMKQQ